MSRAPLLSRRKALIGGALLGTAVLSEFYVPRRSARQLDDKAFNALIPLTIGTWRYVTASGLIQPPEDQLSRSLYEQLVTRVYGAPDRDAVMLALAYSSIQEGRLQLHRPEICYPASGFAISDNVETSVRLNDGNRVPARFLVADRGDRREYILYWTRVGDAMPTRWFEQRLTMAAANLKGYVPDGMLTRMSVIGNDPVAARATLEMFARAMVSSVNATGKAILIGNR